MLGGSLPLQTAVDVDSQVITDVEVTPGNEPDGKSAAGLVKRSEQALNAALEVAEESEDGGVDEMSF